MKKEMWELVKDANYRVDFTYIKANRFVHTVTIDLLDNFYEAKEYIKETYYNDIFPITKKNIEETFRGCDVIKIEIVDIEGNTPMSIYYWHKKEGDVILE